MDELVAYVRAALDARERAARAAIDQGGIGKPGEAYWHRCHSDRRSLIGDMAGNVVVHGIDETWSPSSYQADHIVLNDPAYVLADIAAKRVILDLHAGEHDCPEMVTGAYPADWPESAPWGKAGQPWAHPSVEHFELGQPCPTVRALARPYAGRDGWRAEWTA